MLPRETWVFKNMTCAKLWKDIVGESTAGTIMVPSVRAERSILSHIGCAETELLDDRSLLFRGSKSVTPQKTTLSFSF